MSKDFLGGAYCALTVVVLGMILTGRFDSLGIHLGTGIGIAIGYYVDRRWPWLVGWQKQ